ncbi:uncharacterized protein LOC114328345 [Diabrotica virgifera virgifera]|uniref:Uncharacterized protein LOC114328345 n=1 Tax=Diabrotica virgifera virgifera TaxID=50390 RepID=A0A6P7FBK1_DIAVI|nr:uncharacterized protein LOC114328345 [Diabrotica virgifera virgifera]
MIDMNEKEIDTCSLNSNDSDTTIIDYSITKDKVKNIYDLSEFEECEPHERRSPSTSPFQDEYVPEIAEYTCTSQNVLRTEKLSPSTSPFHDESHPQIAAYTYTSRNVQETIILSSDDESEYNKINAEIILKHKNSTDLALEKDNTIFEMQNFDLIENGDNQETHTDSQKKKRGPRKKNTENDNDGPTKEPSSPKQKKKKLSEKEINLKKVQKTIQKHSRDPEKSIEELTLNIDQSILNNIEYGESIKTYLEDKGIPYVEKPSSQDLISWTRKVEKIEDEEIIEFESQEGHYMKIVTPAQFGNLIPIITSLKSSTNFDHLTILVYGIGKPTDKQELEILEAEMFFPTFWNFVRTKEAVASFIYMATKAVSYYPYKAEKEEKDRQQNEYFNDVNKDVVKVDKNGNGLNRLWRQMLTKFPLARLETAEAITTVYPTMSSLCQAYETSTEPGEVLVQDLPIRRAQGPLASVRKLGPEFSKKCHNFFMSESNRLL